MHHTRYTITLALLFGTAVFQRFNVSTFHLFAQDTLWVRYDDRFKANAVISLKGVDSVAVLPTQMRFYNTTSSLGYTNKSTNQHSIRFRLKCS